MPTSSARRTSSLPQSSLPARSAAARSSIRGPSGREVHDLRAQELISQHGTSNPKEFQAAVLEDPSVFFHCSQGLARRMMSMMGASTSASELTLDFRRQIARDLRGQLLRAASTAGESGFTETDEEEPQDEVNATPRRPDAKEAETKDEADPGGTHAASLRASLTTSAPPVDSAASPASTPLERAVRRGGGRSKPQTESAALLKAYLDARAAEQAAARQTAPQQATSRSRKGRQTASQQARTVSVQSDVVIPTVALMSPSARQSRVVQPAPSPPATPPSSASSASSSSSSSSSAESASASSDSSTDSASSGHCGSSRKRRRRHRGRRGSARHKDGKSEAEPLQHHADGDRAAQRAEGRAVLDQRHD